MKKWLSFLLVLVLCLTLTACGGGREESSAPPTDGNSTTTTASVSTGSVTETTTTGVSPQTNTTGGITTTAAQKPATTSHPTMSATVPATTSTTKAQQTQYACTPLLYKVTNPAKGNFVYLFGSIHVGQKDMYPLPPYVMNAFNACDSLAVEVDIVKFEQDMQAQMEALSCLVYTDGTTITDHLPAELYQAAVAILKENSLYDPMLDYYCPSMWSDFIDSALYTKAGVDGEQGVDRYLLGEAKKKGMPIGEIESAQEQYGMLAKFSEPLQQVLLASSIEQYKDISGVKTQMKELLTAWKKGDLTALKTLVAAETEFVDDTERQLYEEYQMAMTTLRDEKMASYIANRLNGENNVFVCVGAAHVVGENGIIDRLKKQGFTVEQVKG
ncbi:MAG: TraB/GumN family protein [Clostridia bacterium]|nr:TraB/GumN family protein [Clostridia bacterium]